MDEIALTCGDCLEILPTLASGSIDTIWGFICWHPILVYGADPFLAHGEGGRPDAMIMRNSNDINNTGHPCPKPFNVMRWIIERTTRQGELVLDPFMGSGTTGVACVQLGRRFMGIEMNPDYFALAEKRIAEARAQGNFLASIPDVKPTQPRLAL